MAPAMVSPLSAVTKNNQQKQWQQPTEVQKSAMGGDNNGNNQPVGTETTVATSTGKSAICNWVIEKSSTSNWL